MRVIARGSIGSALGLVALAMQVLLAFAHVHVGPVSGQSSGWAKVVAKRGAARDLGHADTWSDGGRVEPGSGSLPPQPHEHRPGCPACLASWQATLAPPPASAMVVGHDPTVVDARVRERPPSRPSAIATAFQARGPPHGASTRV